VNYADLGQPRRGLQGSTAARLPQKPSGDNKSPLNTMRDQGNKKYDGGEGKDEKKNDISHQVFPHTFYKDFPFW